MKNTNKEILRKIKNTIIEIANELNIKVDKIILFGSRARGDAKEDSDWDILVVTKKKLSKDELFEFLSKVYLKLAEYGINGEILVRAKEEFRRKARFYGSIFYFIKKEGIKI